MSVTYDPDNPLYTDVDDVSREIGRVFDICHGCRVCFNLCPSFTDLFNSIDALSLSAPIFLVAALRN